MAFLVRSNQWGYYGILLNNEEFSVFPFEFNGLVCEEPSFVEAPGKFYGFFNKVTRLINATPVFGSGTFRGVRFETSGEKVSTSFEYEQFYKIVEEFKAIVSGPLEGLPLLIGSEYFEHLVKIRLELGE